MATIKNEIEDLIKKYPDYALNVITVGGRNLWQRPEISNDLEDLVSVLGHIEIEKIEVTDEFPWKFVRITVPAESECAPQCKTVLLDDHGDGLMFSALTPAGVEVDVCAYTVDDEEGNPEFIYNIYLVFRKKIPCLTGWYGGAVIRERHYQIDTYSQDYSSTWEAINRKYCQGRLNTDLF